MLQLSKANSVFKLRVTAETAVASENMPAFNSVCSQTCSLSRSVCVTQSVRQMGPPQIIESDDIAPALVQQHSFGELDGNDPPPETQDINCCRGDLHGSLALHWELYCVQCVKCHRSSEADLVLKIHLPFSNSFRLSSVC